MTTPHPHGTRRVVAGVHARRCCPSRPVDTRLRLHRSPGGQVRSRWHTRLRASQPGRATRSHARRQKGPGARQGHSETVVRPTTTLSAEDRRVPAPRPPDARGRAPHRALHRRAGGPVRRPDLDAVSPGARRRSADRAEKALALFGYRRTPNDVTETFVRTSSTVKDASPAPLDLFVKRWKPTDASSKKVFVIAPGFLETGAQPINGGPATPQTRRVA